MKPSIIDLLRKAMRSPDKVSSMGDDVYSIRTDDGIILAWGRDDAISILSGDANDVEECDVFIGLHGDGESNLPRIASSDGVRLNLGGRPILFRFSQYGGQGGMLPSTGFGIGMGPGAGSALSGVDQFGSNIVRQQFDISLEQTRKSREDNDWDRSLEARLQSSPIYGHQRNEKDRNLEPYTKTFNERRQLKRRRYLQRRKENNEKALEQIKNNSVEAIKNIAPDPRHIVPTEFRLKERRQSPDPEPGEKRKYHGPESEFVHFPKTDSPTVFEPTIRTAYTNQYGLGTTFDDRWQEDAMSEILSPKPSRMSPVSGKVSTNKGTEAGLSEIHGGGTWPSISPNLPSSPVKDPYVGGRERIQSLPPSMGEQVSDLSGGIDRYLEENEKDLYLNDLNMPFLADQYATNSEPSQGSPFLSPAETEQMAEAFRDKMKKFVEKRSPSGDRDDGVEKKLKRLHRGWPWVGRQRPTEEYLGPPQPYPSYSDSSRLMRNTPSGQGVI